MRRHGPTSLVALLLLTGTCSRPPADGLADEYAVWSAAIDAALGDTQYRTVTAAPATVFRGAGSRDEQPEWRRRGVTREMLGDLVARNRTALDIDVRRLATRRVRVLPQGIPLTKGTLELARPGFDRTHGRAVVTVWVECGSMCARGSMLLMQRGFGGRWRVAARLWDAIS